MDTWSKIYEHLTETAAALHKISGGVVRAVEILKKAQQEDHTVWLIGNGGSASTASHFANDLVKQCRLRAICLMDMIPMVTAFANDLEWDLALREMFDNFHTPGDVLIAFSCSGESENIIRVAQSLNAVGTIVFTGDREDSNLLLTSKPEVVIHVQSPYIMVQESVHLTVCHAIVAALKASQKQIDSADAVAWAMKRMNPYAD